MKTRNFFYLLVTAMLLSACSVDETNINDENANLKINIESVESRAPFTMPCIITPCESNYQFRKMRPSLNTYTLEITYPGNIVSPSEIACVRQEYFKCFTYIYLDSSPSTNPNSTKETWVIPFGWPEEDVVGTACEDPRTETSCDD